MEQNTFKISVCERYDKNKTKDENNDQVAYGWHLIEREWAEEPVADITTTCGISCNEYPSGHRGNEDWVATHSLMLDFDNGEMAVSGLFDEQQNWTFDSFVYTSQNHQKQKVKKDGTIEEPCDRLRALIPLASPIGDERTLKAVKAYLLEQYPMTDITFLDQSRYFAHGTTAETSFVSGRGPFDWTTIPNLHEYRDRVSVSTWKKKEEQLIKLSDPVLDRNKQDLRIEDIVPDQPIYCPFCGQSDERGGDGHNAVIKINGDDLPFLFCSSCKSRGHGHAGVYNFDDPDRYIYRLNLEDKLVFIDVLKSKYMGGCFEPGQHDYVCRELGGTEHVRQFCHYHKVPYPRVYPRARYELIFNSDQRADFDAGYVNIYNAPAPLREPVPKAWVPERPETIHRIIDHVFAHDTDIVDRFYNNMAWFTQTRQKLITSFLMQGVEGTGKGLLFERVFQAIFGTQHSTTVDQDAFGNQFNSFLTQNVLVLVNEVSGNFSASAGKNLSTIEKMKIAITDVNVQIEGKSKDRYNGKNVCSFLFATNRRDGITLSDNDRRFNVAPRQEMKIQDTAWWPGYDLLIDAIQEELQDFVWYLKTFPVDASLVTKVIDNAPKRVLQVMSKTNAELFFDAVKSGNIRWILENIVQGDTWDAAARYSEIESLARGLIKKDRVSSDTLRRLYNNISTNTLKPVQFGKLATEQLGIESKTMKIDGKSSRGYMIDWDDFNLVEDNDE